MSEFKIIKHTSTYDKARALKKETKVKFKGYTYIFVKKEEESRVEFEIRTQRANEDKIFYRICILLTVDENESGTVYLDRLQSSENCSIENLPGSNKGSLLLELVIKFAENLDARYVTLFDAAQVKCKKIPVNLNIITLLTSGYSSWYQKYGFEYRMTKKQNQANKNFMRIKKSTVKDLYPILEFVKSHQKMANQKSIKSFINLINKSPPNKSVTAFIKELNNIDCMSVDKLAPLIGFALDIEFIFAEELMLDLKAQKSKN